MANRVKEDEKNEKIIRNLLKLPENRRCINCNSLGPQYVCINFSTFICTTCSGIHREFTHRVKSVSMAKFTPLEISALQGGGNASAREIYLKEWDPQRNSLDGSNIERLRDFIKHVYVDRRFTGEKTTGKPPRGETDTYQGSSRSPPSDERTEHRHVDKPGGRSPGFDPENRKNSDHRRTSLIEIVNDWRREDRFVNGRKSEDKNSDGGTKSEVKSPDHQKDPELLSPPEVRPVREILGESVTPLRVIEPLKINSQKSTEDQMHTQGTASSSQPTSDANPLEIKMDAPFIDFDSYPEPQKTGTAPVVQQPPAVEQPAANVFPVEPTSSESNNWANFDSMQVIKPQTAVSNSVESILSDFSVPTSGVPSPFPANGASAVRSSAPQIANVQPSYLSNSAPAGNLPAFGPQNSGFLGGIERPLSQRVAPVDGPFSSNNQGWNPPPQNPRAPSIFPANQHVTNSLGLAKEQSLEPKSSGRKALPEDLFTMNFSYAPSPAFSWYPRSYYPAGLTLQYNAPSASWQPVPNQPAVARSVNPFEAGHEQPPMFPSMASLQGVLPQTASPALPRASGLVPNPVPPVYASSFHRGALLRGDGLNLPSSSSSFSVRPHDMIGLNPNNSSGFTSLHHPGHSGPPSNLTSSSGNPFDTRKLV